MKLLAALTLLLFLTLTASAQRTTAGRLYSGTAAPTGSCITGPPVTDFYWRTNTQQMYFCGPSGWAVMPGAGGGGGGLGDPGINGIVKRTALNTTSTAVAGTDYLSPTGDGSQLSGITFSQIVGTVTDAQIPNNITVDIANSGDSATAFFPSGTLEPAIGGTGVGIPADDQVLVGNGTTYQLKTLPSCSNGSTDKLLYNASTNTFSCGSDQGPPLPVTDTTSIVKGSVDPTKEIRFEVDGLTTGTVRVLTVPDSNTTLPVISQIITIGGPTAARTYTFPDVNATMATTDTDQTFSGKKTFTPSASKAMLNIGVASANPSTPVAGDKFLNSGDNREYTYSNGAWREVFLAGISLVNLGTNVTSTLPVTNGGSGATTLTGVLKGNGTSAFTAAVAGTDYLTPTGAETLSNKTLTNPAITLQTLTDGATINWNAASGNMATVTLGGNRTMAAPTNLKTGGSYSLTVTQDGTGSRTVTWNGVFKWPSGTAPTLTTTANRSDLITCVSNDGTNLLCNALLDVR